MPSYPFPGINYALMPYPGINLTIPPSAVDAVASIDFGADGSLSGSVPIAVAIGDRTPSQNGSWVAVEDGLMTFAFTGPTPDGQGGLDYAGGSFSVSGELPGGSQEVILSGNLGAFHFGVDPVWPGLPPDSARSWAIFAAGAPFEGAVLALDAATLFGATSPGNGLFGLDLTQQAPGGPVKLYAAFATFFTVATD